MSPNLNRMIDCEQPEEFLKEHVLKFILDAYQTYFRMTIAPDEAPDKHHYVNLS